MLAKKVFLERLYQDRADGVQCGGIVHQLVHIASKYNLQEYINTFVLHTTFPNKKAWKSLVNTAVCSFEDKRVNAILQEQSLSRFKNVYGCNLHFHPVWVAENSTSSHRKYFRDLAKLNCLLCSDGKESQCLYCNKVYSDQL